MVKILQKKNIIIHKLFTNDLYLLSELCASIKAKQVGNNLLLNYDWSDKFKYDEDKLKDVEKIKSLMRKRMSPRRPYFNNKKTIRRTMMTFTMKNQFYIDKVNWPSIMRSHLSTWSAKGYGLIRLIRKCKSTSIKIINSESCSLSPIPSPMQIDSGYYDDDDYGGEKKYNMYQLESDEILKDNCISNDPKVHKRRLENFTRMNDEQKSFLLFVRNDVISMSNMNEPSVKCMLLTGHAGSGKTSTLECLRDLGNVSLKYIAITQRLCAAVRRNFNITTLTFCSFMIKALGMKPLDIMILMDAISYLSANTLLDYEFTGINRNSIKTMFNSPFHPIDPDDPESKLISPKVNIIFLDEISMFAPPLLECFVSIVKVISVILREKFIIILAGDFMQISPLLTTSMDYEPIFGICESVFNFKQQHRIVDQSYLNVVMKLTNDTLMCSQQFLVELKKVIPDSKFSQEIKYAYPFKLVENAYDSLKTATNLYIWLKTLPPNFFADILPINVFVFTNREMHYMNLLLAFAIISQFKDREIIRTITQQFICFSTFTKNGTDLVWPIQINNEHIVPVLPLIRFFPYRLLAMNINLPDVYNKCLVFLIDWNFAESSVTVYCPAIEKFLTVPVGSFKMNLSNSMLYGIPLELAFCTTYHSSQGLTLTGDIVVSLNNIDFRELFVVLTRVRSSEQIQNIFFTNN